MKIKSTFKVILESEDGKAELTFKKPKISAYLDRFIGDKNNVTGESLRTVWASILSDLVDIKGLQHEDGTEVQLDEVKSLSLDVDTCLAIIAGYNAGLSTKGADTEKKDS